MNNDADWVEDVKRWYFSASSAPGGEAEPATDFAIGYEAAQPALQARHWPDAPSSSLERPPF